MMESTPDRLAQINAEIAHNCKIAKRQLDSVQLIAVSKTKDSNDIIPLLHAGHRRFGENRVQEAQTKWPELKSAYADVELHLIGQLQSNKAVDAVHMFDCIHTLDRQSLILALGAAMREAGKNLPCFLQVNIGDEPQKGGCAIADIAALLELAKSENIAVVGLMCLPPAGIEAAPFFALLAELAARHDLPQLSMGMSDDFGTAVQMGATHVRVGSALFGKRAV